jgi:hypothetical protein
MKTKIMKIGTKIIFLGVLLFGLNFSSQAQSNKEEIDYYQAAFGMDKKEMVVGFLQLKSDNPFWAIYDQYETERKSIGQKRVKLLQDYANNYLNLSDAQIDAIMKEAIDLNISSNKLIDNYYYKIKKASGSKPAAQFYQIEQFIQSTIRIQIMGNIPFIGELDDAK